jgi:hypothetical protein
MGWIVIENGSVQVDLVALANTTGWSGSGSIATHDSCNAGSTYLKPPTGLTITAGKIYQISYFVNSISGGLVQPYMGDTAGTAETTAGFKTESLLCTGTDPRFRFYSNANCEIEIFAIRDTTIITTLKQRNTIAYNEQLNKWTSFYTYIPDCGFGLFIKLYTVNRGNLYVHDGDSSRNEFYGVQYSSILKFVSSLFSTQVKNFQTLSYQSNQLMITTEDGIETNLGQVSELVSEDFLNYVLRDGVTMVNIYDREGLYQASFQRDKLKGGIINGDTLRGNYITAEIVTTNNAILKLYTVSVQSAISYTGIR